jgi:S-adenosylmethionine hydrolase
LHADHFGNLLTSLGSFTPSYGGKVRLSPWIGSKPEIEIDLYKSSLKLPNGEILPWISTFGQIPEGECAFMLGSSGLIEIAANRKSAANLLHLAGDEIVTLTIPSKP